MSNEKYAFPNGMKLLCENAVNAKFSDLSEWNVKCVRDRLLDIVGCIFGGAIVKDNDVLISMLRKCNGDGDGAPVFALGFRLPVGSAAMVNCITSRSNDYGSMAFRVFNDRFPAHLGETLLPMGLTLADVHGASGEDYIINQVIGEDMVGRAIYPMKDRWASKMKFNAPAAAAVAARYYGFDAAKLKTAVSFAATNNTTPIDAYFSYSQMFKYHNGISARTAIEACELAKGGWNDLRDAFYGPDGIVVYQTNNNLPDNVEKTFEDLGKVFFMEESFKRFPAGLPTTPVGVAGQNLHYRIAAERGKVDPEDIQKVVVYQHSSVSGGNYARPLVNPTQLNAMFCYRFVACCTLLYGDCTIAMVQDEAVKADKVLYELASNAEQIIFEDPASPPCLKVRVYMKDGAVYEEVGLNSLQSEYPTEEFLIEKFRKQVKEYGKLSKAKEDKIIQMALSIEKVKDMREFTELLMP